jgi:hypothetical protein
MQTHRYFTNTLDSSNKYTEHPFSPSDPNNHADAAFIIIANVIFDAIFGSPQAIRGVKNNANSQWPQAGVNESNGWLGSIDIIYRCDIYVVPRKEGREGMIQTTSWHGLSRGFVRVLYSLEEHLTFRPSMRN